MPSDVRLHTQSSFQTGLSTPHTSQVPAARASCVLSIDSTPEEMHDADTLSSPALARMLAQGEFSGSHEPSTTMEHEELIVKAVKKPRHH